MRISRDTKPKQKICSSLPRARPKAAVAWASSSASAKRRARRPVLLPRPHPRHPPLQPYPALPPHPPHPALPPHLKRHRCPRRRKLHRRLKSMHQGLPARRHLRHRPGSPRLQAPAPPRAPQPRPPTPMASQPLPHQAAIRLRDTLQPRVPVRRRQAQAAPLPALPPTPARKRSSHPAQPASSQQLPSTSIRTGQTRANKRWLAISPTPTPTMSVASIPSTKPAGGI